MFTRKGEQHLNLFVSQFKQFVVVTVLLQVTKLISKIMP